MLKNPVATKLKLLAEEKNLIMKAPDSFKEHIKGIPFDVTHEHDEYEYVQVFVKSIEEVIEFAAVALKAIKEDGKIWFCYPKKTSGIKTDINRDQGWNEVWKKGYGGVAAVSIDDTWSALRFRHESKVDRKGEVKKSPAKATGGERTLEIPEAIKGLLQLHPQVKESFEQLAYTHRKEYVLWINDAKRPETLERRLQQMLERLKERKKRY